MTNKRLFFKTLALLCFITVSSQIFAQKPNILIIMADDCTYSDLPLYGGLNVRTPRTDKLATEGVTFNKAYVTMSMCAPCRAELYTGMQPARNGVCWNHSIARTAFGLFSE